jgi:hypothetical protein
VTPVSQIDKVVLRLGDQLAADEFVLHAVPAFHLGGARSVIRGGFRAGGTVIAAAVTGAAGGTGAAPGPGPLLPLPQRCVVALTSQRLLVFSGGMWTNAPVNLLHDIPLLDVVWVGGPAPDGRIGKSERVIVGLASGAMLGWEFARLYLAPGRALTAELAAQVSRRPEHSN